MVHEETYLKKQKTAALDYIQLTAFLYTELSTMQPLFKQ